MLRPYQERGIEQLRARVRTGRRAPLLVAPTGAGKTVIITGVIAGHVALKADARVLVVAHRRELVGQIAARLRSSGFTVDEIHPDAAPETGAVVVVASTQTLRARAVLPTGITLVIFDEAHHYSSDDWSALTTAYDGVLRVGFTATPCRSDGRGLSPAFDALVVVATVKELTAAGHLVPCKVIAPAAPLSARELVCSPLEAYQKHANGRRTVIFAEFVADAIAFRDSFVDAGIPAVVIHGELPSAEREEALRAHREDGAVLVNCMVLTEGWDSPETSVCILARGCGSVGTYLQIVGRVLRTAPGKAEALVIDLTGRAFHTHGAPDEDRVFSLTGKGIRSKGRTDGMTCFVCGSLVDAWPCDVCGHVPTGANREPLKLVGGDLAERFALKRSEDDGKRIATLARWMAETRARGWNMRSVYRKFAAVYGAPASPEMISAAFRASHQLTTTACAQCRRETVRTYRGGRCGKCAFGESQKGAA